MPPIWVGFWVKNSQYKGPFFSKFSLNMGGFSRNWQNIVEEDGSFPPKLIIEMGIGRGGGHWGVCDSAFPQFFCPVSANPRTEIGYFRYSLGS